LLPPTRLLNDANVCCWPNATDIVLEPDVGFWGVLRKWLALSGIAKQRERGSGLPNIM
jgi:hypothetical protein